MMISTKGRYALRVMIDLAQQDTQRYIPLKEVAQRQEISEKYAELIVKCLVAGRLVEGVRGKGGGYRLLAPPSQCSVGQILRLTEGDLAPVACLGVQAPLCPRAETCRTLPMWKKLDRMIGEFFDGISLADLLQSDGEDAR